VPASATAQDGGDERPDTVDVQLLAFNDFHGQLEPPSGSGANVPIGGGRSVVAGGAEYLSTHLQRLEDDAQDDGVRTSILSTGDAIGGSPLLSALFHDEPSIEAMNRMGVDMNVVGNHEFDEGVG